MQINYKQFGTIFGLSFVLLACFLIISPNSSNSTQLFQKHTNQSDKQRCILKQTLNFGCQAYASQSAADDLFVLTDFQKNYATNEQQVYDMSNTCFKSRNPKFWSCMDQVYEQCLDTNEKNNKKNNNQGQNPTFKKFTDLQASLYKEQCFCDATPEDINERQQLVFKAKKFDDYKQLSEELNKLSDNKKNKYWQCVSEDYVLEPQFKNQFTKLNKVCDKSYSTKTDGGDRQNLKDIVQYTEKNPKSTYQDLKDQLTAKKLKDAYFQCIEKEVDAEIKKQKEEAKQKAKDAAAGNKGGKSQPSKGGKTDDSSSSNTKGGKSGNSSNTKGGKSDNSSNNKRGKTNNSSNTKGGKTDNSSNNKGGKTNNSSNTKGGKTDNSSNNKGGKTDNSSNNKGGKSENNGAKGGKTNNKGASTTNSNKNNKAKGKKL